MSVTRMTPNYSQSSSQRCNRCHIPIPRNATFCGTCGERFDKQNSIQLLNKADIAERYRITSLVRRRPYVQLFIAIDNLRQQPVVIRDIDISSLDEGKQTQAVEAVQQEHDLLRQLSVHDVMPIIDLRSFQGHLYTVAAWPFGFRQREYGSSGIPRNTLQDLLQSGIGLPDEQIAISWIYRLCQAVERLHQEEIILGDLDPYVIIVSDQEYDGLPALMISWLPLSLRNLFPYISTATNIVPASVAETLYSAVEKQTDIYSLGALLYLLLTGTSPKEFIAPTQHLARASRNLTPGVNSNVDTIIKRALATKGEERFQNAAAMADALLELCIGTSAPLANIIADQYIQTRVLKHPPFLESGRTLRADDGDATIIAPLPQLRRKITKALTSGLKMRVAHMNEASGALENTEHPNEPQSIIIEELSMGTDPTMETEAMLEPSAKKMETVIEPPAEKTKQVIEPPAAAAGNVPESAPAAEMATPPITETEVVIELSSHEAETMTEPPTTEAEAPDDPAAAGPVTITGPLLTEAEAASLEKETETQTAEPSSALIEIGAASPENAMSVPAEASTELPEDEATVPPEIVSELPEDDAAEQEEATTGPLLPEVTVESEFSSAETENEHSELAMVAEGDSSALEAAAEPNTDAPSSQIAERVEPIAPAAMEEQFFQDSQVIEYSLVPTASLQNGHTIEAAPDGDPQKETASAPAVEQTSIETEPAQEEPPPTQPLPDASIDAIPDSSTISGAPPSLVQRMLGRVSGVLPAKGRVMPEGAETQETPLLKRLQRFVLGEQQHVTTAAALIETPLRIQPNQIYSIRIHMMGRDEPDPGSIYGGLSAVTKGETVHIEVRSALYRNFAYIVQQADVTMPGKGYAAEVTMPMQAFSQGPSGRRERLHIFFTDEARRPLYERPFVIEVFISHLVQSGREGHNVLSIPL